MNQNKRREFIKKSTIGGVLTLSIPEIIASVKSEGEMKKITLNQDDVILFQGDSITDAGRSREEEETDNHNNQSLGDGYAFLAAAELLYQHAAKKLKIYNKGISGNKVYQLAERWDTDAFDLNPNVLSILIGVNDFWHTLTNNYSGTIETYQNDLKALLEKTKERLPEVKFIIGEPFAVKGIKAVDDQWYPAFDEYRKAALEIANDFDAVFIPYQSVFDKAQKSAPGAYWTYDGVHPTLAGSQLMAHAWLDAVK